jgi:hypothetical protein
MKKVSKVFVILVVFFALTSVAYAKDPPGKASNFYRGVTTLAPAVTSELSSSTSVVLSSESVYSEPVVSVIASDPVVVETRVIGNGQSNNGQNGNLQDKTAVTKKTTTETMVTTTSIVETTNVYEVTTVLASHRGAPVSNGKALEPIVTVAQETEVVVGTDVSTSVDVQTTETTEVSDWGPAYDVPSGIK